ncbi:hypothetical protein, partial [Collinsella sp. 1033st1_B10_1033SCRN_220408]|uniref:hypothetical protein n=1 Tax=Collinsella sp. 1033st1_B10_1033SCRN_220408 TaxID=3143055 RepID=UPI00319E9CEF
PDVVQNVSSHKKPPISCVQEMGGSSHADGALFFAAGTVRIAPVTDVANAAGTRASRNSDGLRAQHLALRSPEVYRISVRRATSRAKR